MRRPVLPIVLFASVGSVACWGQLALPIFQDVPASATYYNQVNMLRERLITNGCQASPQMFCPDYWPNGYTPYFLTRGQAATLIVRSLFSGLSGDPENFWAPESAYFTDVQGGPYGHPQFKYIQKLKELGITSGCTATEFCPEREISYGEFSVFVYRAREKKRMDNQYYYVPPPEACTYDLFGDVLTSHPFCAYIKAVYNSVGSNAISPECPSGNFCPDVAFDQYQQWVSGVRVKRGTASFYLVKGILDAGFPHMLATSNGQLRTVSSVGGPEDCQYNGPAMMNAVVLVGSQLYGYSLTTMSNYSDVNFWSFTVAPTLKENTIVKYSTEHSRAGSVGGAEVYTPMIPFNQANNYEQNVSHLIASACLEGGGTSAVNWLPYPTLFTASQQVLYRGTYQQVSFRGTTLQGAGVFPAVHLRNSENYSEYIISAGVSTALQFDATLGFTTPTTVPAGQHRISLFAQYTPPFGSAGPAVANSSVNVHVADPTPVLTSLSQYSGTQGDSFTLYLNGLHFGANPQVCINGACTTAVNASASSMVSALDLTFVRNAVVPWSNEISVAVTIPSNATPGSYSISVLSTGMSGAAGSSFAFAPNGTSTPSSGSLNFLVQAVALEMRLSGANISGTTQNVVAGQKIDLQVVIVSTGGQLIQSMSWAIPGSAIGGWSVPTTSPFSPAVVTPIGGVNANAVAFYWTGAQTGLIVRFTVLLGNGSSHNVSATFNVTVPQVTVSHSRSLVSCCVGYRGSLNGQAAIQFNTEEQPGITFSYSVNAGPSGSYQWVQRVESSVLRIRAGATGGWLRHTYPPMALDNIYPYETAVTVYDSPGTPLSAFSDAGYNEFTREDNYSMFLMFRPSGVDSIFVPVHRVDWNWFGHAIFTAGNWMLVSSPTASNSIPSSILLQPQWSTTIMPPTVFNWVPE